MGRHRLVVFATFTAAELHSQTFPGSKAEEAKAYSPLQENSFSVGPRGRQGPGICLPLPELSALCRGQPLAEHALQNHHRVRWCKSRAMQSTHGSVVPLPGFAALVKLPGPISFFNRCPPQQDPRLPHRMVTLTSRPGTTASGSCCRSWTLGRNSCVLAAEKKNIFSGIFPACNVKLCKAL